MRRALRAVLGGLAAVALVAAALFSYFAYAPAPAVPHLTGRPSAGSVAFGGHVRTYLLYVPRGLPKGAPLVMALHGSGEDGARMRVETGYGFERLADAHRFALVYPKGYEGYWNACNRVGDYAANALNVDDVGFLSALANKLAAELGIDRGRVFAIGVSRGGQMALRLALEAPERFRAVAAVSANLPVPGNFKCKPAGRTSSVMIMNGTEDPLVPFDGGEVNLLGFFMKRGFVLSSRASALYFAQLNGLTAAPETRQTQVADGVGVEEVLWRGPTEVELVAIHGGGHSLPQPYRRGPRLLGPTPREPNGPVMIWDFFARQRSR